MACCIAFAFFAAIALSLWAKATCLFSRQKEDSASPICWRLPHEPIEDAPEK